MTPLDIHYARLCCAVWCAGVTIWQERMDAMLAPLDANPSRPVRDKHGIPEDDDVRSC
jgi:hypothetical protein